MTMYMKWTAVSAVAVLALGAAALATPSMGFLVNQILASGVAGIINQQVQINPDPNVAGDEPWQVQLQAQGATDVYVQRLELAPGGYSGWHSHPGVLVGTLTAGSIDFYDGECRKITYRAGQSFQENNQPHGIINNGSVPAEMTIFYMVKRGAARRLEADAPACGASVGIP